MENKNNLLVRAKAVDSDSRRRFLRYAGFSALTATTVLAACENATLEPAAASGARIAADGSIDLGSGDVGILNYAYALEQLEYAFYAQVIANPYGGMSSMERSILTDIRDHEKAHRDFFRAALGGAAIPMLNANFGAVNFSDRGSVLTTARVFEDLGVSAYNGAGRLLTDGNNLSTAGKIVSVEARHAAIIRELLSPFSTSFAGDDVVTTDTGLDVVNMPSTVLAAAQPFIVERITANNLPTM
ncbi:MAG: ferritin-like domain-containing protein [Cytophagales bacterium]|nr:MAG: ferritin-like domain-containing protein [Cytophagales bacterium]